jgi:UDP-arabinose 4-epimerase
MGKGTILVAGGAGYIGSQCAKELSRQGYEPVVVDNLCTGYRKNVRWGPFVEGDISDPALMDRVFRQHEVLAVMHFAAHALVAESMSDPGKYYRNNVAATLSLLESMVRCKVPRFIFSSTCATYGMPRHTPMREDHPQEPINTYGTTKLMVERMLADFDRAHGLRYTALRYFNAAGADPDLETGEEHVPESHLIPTVLDAALGKLPSVKLFGKDYDTPDGTCVRDYIHTVDLSTAHILAVERLLSGAPSAVYNLGNGEGYSVLQVIETVRKAAGRDFRVDFADRRPGDPPRLVGSSAKAKAELEWKPRFGSLEAIVKTALDFRTASSPAS